MNIYLCRGLLVSLLVLLTVVWLAWKWKKKAAFDIIRVQFPECIPERIDWVLPMGFYQRTAAAAPRYNHTSCRVMKAKYNCATDANATTKEQAKDFELVLNITKKNKPCHLRLLVDTLLHTGWLDEQPAMDILLLGDSLLRQIWEALACGFSNHIHTLRVQQGGPTNFSASAPPILLDQLGRPLDLSGNNVTQGCHGTHNISHYYAPNVQVPSNLPDCNDNVAKVAFGSKGQLRVSYMYHPEAYEKEAFNDIIQHRFGISLQSTTTPTWVLYNSARRRRPRLDNKLLPDHTIYWNIASWRSDLRDWQWRDLGHFYGADNPGISPRPDEIHACMPGLPDDEVNLLFWYLLWTGYAVR